MRRIFALLLIMIMVLSLVACGEKKEEAPVGGEAQQQPKAKDWPSEVVIVSGTTGGTSYYIGAGQAQILTEAIDGVSFVTEATNASVTQNGPLVQGDASIMGHFVISALMQAREGTYPGLDAKLDKIYLIQVGNSTRPQFITLKENKINDFSDLKGKKIGVPPVTTVVYVATMRV